MKNILTAILTLTVLLGCSSTTSMSLKEKNNEYAKYVKDENLLSKDEVKGFKFKDWNSLSDNYLILTAPHKKDYLIQTSSKCSGLNRSRGIILNRKSNFSLDTNGDFISLVNDEGVNEGVNKCIIKSIYSITAEQIDHLVNIDKQV